VAHGPSVPLVAHGPSLSAPGVAHGPGPSVPQWRTGRQYPSSARAISIRVAHGPSVRADGRTGRLSPKWLTGRQFPSGRVFVAATGRWSVPRLSPCLTVTCRCWLSTDGWRSWPVRVGGYIRVCPEASARPFSVGAAPARARIVWSGSFVRVAGPRPDSATYPLGSRVRAAANASPLVRSRPKPVPPTKGFVHGLSIADVLYSILPDTYDDMLYNML
jgi:hypothetical protein